MCKIFSHMKWYTISRKNKNMSCFSPVLSQSPSITITYMIILCMCIASLLRLPYWYPMRLHGRINQVIMITVCYLYNVIIWLPYYYIGIICNRYHMVGSALCIIKPATPRAQPEGEGLYNPQCTCLPCDI
jgi:hypothetical protein